MVARPTIVHPLVEESEKVDVKAAMQGAEQLQRRRSSAGAGGVAAWQNVGD